ncbi:MAG: hypothetical protein AAB336_10535 [Acidobacteriota bacterium]
MLNEYEKKVIKLLISNIFSSNEIEEIIKNSKFVGLEDNAGSGYFITIHHANFPKDYLVCSIPTIIGEFDDVNCGFVIFLENNELTLECHSWGEKDLPQDFRKKDIQLREF